MELLQNILDVLFPLTIVFYFIFNNMRVRDLEEQVEEESERLSKLQTELLETELRLKEEIYKTQNKKTYTIKR